MTQNRSNFADAYKEIYEKLKPSDGAGAYVKDFKKSDAPQFKGKSDEKKQDMAIAAYLDDKDKSKKEEIDIEAETKYDLEESQVFVVRFLDPKNKKRFAVPYKDKKSADDKMKQLKRDGVKEIEVTKDVLKRGVKFKEEYESIDEGVELDEAKFAVKLSFLPKPIYVDSESAGKVKMQMRKALKKPEDIESVERVMPADYKSDLRNRIKGKKDDEDGEEKTEALDKKDEPAVKDVINQLKGAVKAHGKQAKDLEKALKTEAVSPAQQAAIAISKKEKAKKEAKFDEPEFSKKNYAFNRIGLVAKDLKKKELGKVTDEGRKSKHDMDQDDEEGANKNIIMQLRKSVDLKGRFDVEFEDGKKVKVKDTIARAAVLKHAGFRRPAEKLAFQQKIEKSYRDLLNALKGR